MGRFLRPICLLLSLLLDGTLVDQSYDFLPSFELTFKLLFDTDHRKMKTGRFQIRITHIYISMLRTSTCGFQWTIRGCHWYGTESWEKYIQVKYAGFRRLCGVHALIRRPSLEIVITIVAGWCQRLRRRNWTELLTESLSRGTRTISGVSV